MWLIFFWGAAGMRNLRIFLVLFVLAFLFFEGCAPKQVRLYNVPDSVRGNIVQTALSLQGKPYRSGAKGPDSFDCSGLVHFVFKQNRVLLPVIAEDQGRAGVDVDYAGVLPGDLILFSIDGGSHVGIMVNKSEFVHASKSRGVVVDKIAASYWQKRFVAYKSVL